MLKLWQFALLCLTFLSCFGQNPLSIKTANDIVPPFNGNFRYGSNMGYYAPHTDEHLADIAAKVGINSLRPGFFENFAEFWGYDIRDKAFQHYIDLGMDENVCFLAYPSDAHRDKTVYCGKDTSALFANMYEPIWDKGENGTPVNEKNYYALFVYKTVKRYGKGVKYWEIWNEPDYATTFKTEMAPGLPGAWWNANPDPCEYNLHAPVQHYIRMLRISYEVIKSLEPNDYVCVGGIGFPSFLDILLRQTDNPNGGGVTPQYPLKGGAYFDVLSYHAYPHIDGSVRSWSNKLNGFEYFRHSDKAVEGVYNRKTAHEVVLKKHGYDGQNMPKKHFIITECNIPAKAVGEYMGSYESQRNFIVKSVIKAQVNGLHQFHVYSLGELTHEKDLRNEFDLMGLYKKLEGEKAFATPVTPSGTAYHTTSKILYGYRYDATETAKLQMPNTVDGAAFKHPKTGEVRYCLWAKTSLDQSEKAEAVFNFPTSLSMPADKGGISKIKKMDWDFAATNKDMVVSSKGIKLSGTPVFFSLK
jgi:hypothetical protein